MKKISTSILGALLITLLAASTVFALFTNGSFESGDFSGWTQTHFSNAYPGLSGSHPFTEASIGRTAGGSDQSVVFGPFTALSQTDANSAGNVAYPAYGSYVARVNGPTTGNIANAIYQETTIAAGDVDPVDGQYHVRFVYAAVMEDLGHTFSNQPWFFVIVKNVTQGTTLYEKFSYAAEPGGPWQNGASGWKYLDWSLVDINPGPGGLDVGDTISLEAIAADCAQGGHAGYVYVDGFGPFIPGPTIVATGPASASSGAGIIYTYSYFNGATATVDLNITINEPAGVDIISSSDATNCTVGDSSVTCTFTSTTASTGGSFTVSGTATAAGGSIINHGDYIIAATGYPTLRGPLVATDVPAIVTISGNVGSGGATLSYNDDGPQTATADNLGEYTFTVPDDWSGTVTPSKTGCTFTLANRAYTSVTTDQLNQDYTATCSGLSSGGIEITADRNVVVVGRPHIGSEVTAYDAFESGSLTMYVPMLFKNAWGSYNAALDVQNLHKTNTATVDIKFYDSDGTLSCTLAGESFTPLASKSYWLPDQSCLSTGWVGGAVITSDQPIIAVGRPEIGSQIMAYDGYAIGNSDIYIPMLFKKAWGSYNSAFYIQNVGIGVATLDINFYDTAGNLSCTLAGETFAQFAAKGYWVPGLGCLTNGWVGSVVVSSDKEVVAVARTHVGAQVTSYNAIVSGGLNSYLPMVFKNAFGGSYNSALYVQNLSTTTAATVTPKFYNADGSLECSLPPANISKLSSKGYWVPSLGCLPASWHGSVSFESDQAVASVSRTHVGAEVAASNGFAAGSTAMYLPVLSKTALETYNLALYVRNLDASLPAAVSIKLFDASGNLKCSRSVNLATEGSVGYWLPNLNCAP